MTDHVSVLVVTGAVAVLLIIVYALPAVIAKADPPQEPVTDRMTVDIAHHVMRFHAPCSVSDCPDKRDAYGTLVAAGVIVPDQRVERYVR
ncbi:hypothetical protein [Nocardia sp. CNY236]|uniref:hypothetical protein n=1 Tax=Nocardia sp. CNY236 TaxID=1169152 RepID=UPI00048E004E|nr:hypothetical protein [Nocardia sp. CNY236]